MRRFTLATIALLLAWPVHADHGWPQWRGPHGNGVAPDGDPPLTWSESENVRWKIALPGKGLSTPIVWNDRVFVLTAIETGEPNDPGAVEAAESGLPDWRRQSGVPPRQVLRYTAMALDRTTGETLWRRTLRTAPPDEGTHQDASWASASPVTDGEVLIAHFGSAGTFGLDLDGNLLWDRDLGSARTRRGFGEGSSPALHGDTVVINWDHEGPSFIVALDKRTGHTLWRTERDEPTSWSTPLIVEHGRRIQVVVAATGATRSYDLRTGEVLWSTGGMTTNAIPSPLFDGNERVFVTSGFRGNMLQAIDLADGSVIWSYEEDTPYVPSPVLHDGRLYMLKHLKGILTAFDADSGEKLYGPERLEGLSGVYASLVAAQDRIYVVGRQGNALVLKHGPELEILAVNGLDDAFDASPAIVGGELYLRGREHLYCIAEP